jgi:quercetin dioxygenase-like cupin family protein
LSKQSRALTVVVALSGVAGLSLSTGTPAQATPPGSGVTGTITWRATVGDTDYVLREITIPAGQATGWHYHDGELYGRVQRGTLNHLDASCKPDGVYPRGSTIHEPSGPDHVHIGVNKGKVPVVLEVLYVLPAGSPFSEDAANPGCDFQ